MPSNDTDHLIFKLYLLFNIIFSLPLESRIYDFFNIFEKNGFIISTELKEFLNDVFGFPSLFGQLIKLVKNIVEEKEVYSSFFLFCLIGINLNKIYLKPCIPPVDLFERIRSILDDELKEIILRDIFDALFLDKKDKLNQEVFDIFLKHRKKITLLGIKNIYLYGSILKDNYHKYSDVDLIIRFRSKTNLKKRSRAIGFIETLIFQNLKRDIDIVEFDVSKKLKIIDDAKQIF